jgi:hypothetical protein
LFLLIWLWLGTRSAWLAAIMHGAGNLASSLVFPLTDVGSLYAFSAIGFAIVAIPPVLASWSRWISLGAKTRAIACSRRNRQPAVPKTARPFGR